MVSMEAVCSFEPDINLVTTEIYYTNLTLDPSPSKLYIYIKVNMETTVNYPRVLF